MHKSVREEVNVDIYSIIYEGECACLAFDLFCLNLGFLISPRQRSRDTDTEQEGGTREEGGGV